MSDESRPDAAAQVPPAGQPATAPHADQAKRELLLKALKLGAVVPVVMTISSPAFALTLSHGSVVDDS